MGSTLEGSGSHAIDSSEWFGSSIAVWCPQLLRWHVAARAQNGSSILLIAACKDSTCESRETTSDILRSTYHQRKFRSLYVRVADFETIKAQDSGLAQGCQSKAMSTGCKAQGCQSKGMSKQRTVKAKECRSKGMSKQRDPQQRDLTAKRSQSKRKSRTKAPFSHLQLSLFWESSRTKASFSYLPFSLFSILESLSWTLRIASFSHLRLSESEGSLARNALR